MNGEVPDVGGGGVEALDLPTGDADLADKVHGLLVDGCVDLDELVEEAEEFLAFFVA